jgi:uncharacterized membrane protein
MNNWRDLLYKHWGKISGGIIFFIVGIIYLKYGFLKTIFLLVMTALGIYIGGRKLDGNQDLRDYIGDLWPPRRNRS